MLGRTNFGGGNKINGIIEEYKVASGGNVSAGDFVKFVNCDFTFGTSVRGEESYGKISAILLENNKVFITYGESTSNLMAIICTINENALSLSSAVQISNETNSDYYQSIIKLEDNKVVIIYTGTNGIKATICSVNNNSIVVDSTTLIADFSGYCKKIKSILLSNNKFCVIYGKTSVLKAVICEINNNLLDVGTALVLSEEYYSGEYFSASKINDDSIIVVHGSGNSGATNSLYGIIITISGKVISKGTSTIVINGNNAGEGVEIIKLDNNRFFITHGYSYSILRAFICDVKNQEIIAYTDTVLTVDKDLNAGKNSLPVFLDKNNVFIQYTRKSISSSSSNYNLYGIICRLYDTEVTLKTTKKFDTASISNDALDFATVLANDNSLLTIYHYTTGRKVNPLLIDYSANKINKSNGFEIDLLGIAKTSGTAGQKIKVYTPKIENIESEEI